MYRKTVILAEKPNQAKDDYAPAFEVEKKERTHFTLKPCATFPDGAILTWAIGHLVELKLPGEYKKEWETWNLRNLPIIPDFEYKITDGKRSQFAVIKRLFNQADTIVNACDAGREGSNIFHSILKMTGAKNKKIKRLWINSSTKKAVKEGFDNLLDDKKDLSLYKEAQTRQYADWLVGINTSQLYTLLLQKNGLKTSLSVGRVQTPTVYMIYQRQKEIENFVSKPFYELYANFSHENGKYKGKAKIKTDSQTEIDETLTEHNLSNGTESYKATIKNVSKEMKKTKSPQLYSLTSIQTTANKKWKYNSKEVLKIMQLLYEKKLLTYPRTETVHITENEYGYLKENINDYKKILNVSFENKFDMDKKHVNESKVSDHFAIIPTDEIPEQNKIEKLSQDEKNIYYEVLKTTIAMFHQDYLYEETIIVTDINNIEFFTKGKVEVQKGWKELFSSEGNTEKENDNKTDSNTLPSVSKDDTVTSRLEVVEGHTTPPKPFTEGSIITAMQNAGRLVDDKQESDMLKEVEGIGTVATRADILENIKKREYVESEKNILYVTDKGKMLCKTTEGSLLSSPSMTAKWESYLREIGTGQGSQDKFLKNINKFLSATINEATKRMDELENDIKQHVTEESKENEVSTCPSCGGMIQIKKTKNKSFYGCSNYKDGCKVSFPIKFVGKTLTKNMIKSLCTKKETAKLKGFTGKKGKFDAKLILNDKFEMKFKFN